MRDKVEAVLHKIRPNLVADGGDVQLVDVKRVSSPYDSLVHVVAVLWQP